MEISTPFARVDKLCINYEFCVWCVVLGVFVVFLVVGRNSADKAANGCFSESLSLCSICEQT